MANIEAYRKDVSLYEVAEHIVGDLGQPAVVLVPTADDQEWVEPVVDRTTVEAWDRALKELVAAVRDGKLKVKGRRPGSGYLEEVTPGDLAEVADNPFADLCFTIEYSGKSFFEIQEEHGATIRKSHSNGAPTVLWTDLCADSGAEILKLWPGADHAGEVATGEEAPQSKAFRSRNERKREATIQAIDRINESGEHLDTTKAGENKIIELVRREYDLSISDRYVRLIKADIRNGRRS
jgi:hypothetical protein